MAPGSCGCREELNLPGSLLGAYAPRPIPRVLTAFSVPPKNGMPVECGSGGSGGATGGGKCGGSSLLPRRGLGLATSRGCPGPRCRERVSAPEHEQDSASDGAEIPLSDSRAHARTPEVAHGQRRTGHKHSSHSPCIVPLSPACWVVGVGLGGVGLGCSLTPGRLACTTLHLQSQDFCLQAPVFGLHY